MTAETKAKIDEIIQGNTVEDYTIAYYCMINEGLSESQAVHYIVQNNHYLELRNKHTRFLPKGYGIGYDLKFIGFANEIIKFMENVEFDFDTEMHLGELGNHSDFINFSYRHNSEVFNIQIKALNRH